MTTAMSRFSLVLSSCTDQMKEQGHLDALRWAHELDTEIVWAVEDCRDLPPPRERAHQRRRARDPRRAKADGCLTPRRTRARQVRPDRCCTFDKILAYETWIFPDQHLRFHEALRKTERVVLIGYGFGDKAINTRLIAWLARASEHTLIVCHPRSDELRNNPRGAIQNYWKGWKNEARIKIIPACVADLNYEAIAGHLT
jgi:hypothetical protein